MTSIRPGHRLLTVGPWMLVLLGGIFGGCKPTPPAQDSGGVPDTALTVTPPDSQAPSRPTACKLPSTPEELLACRRGLEFDDLEVAGDEQRLMLDPPCPGKCTYGPLATIRPEKSSHLGREEDLSKGRIIAQLFLNQGEKTGYDKLGLAPGDTTYWWVQKVPGRREGKSAYLTITGGKLVKKDHFTLRYEFYRGAAAARQALARWLWDANDEKTQGTCPGGTCK